MAVQIDQSAQNAKYTFSQWQEGIADSPELGFGVIQNVELGMFPGQAVPGLTPIQWTQTLFNKSYTVDAGTDVFTTAAADTPRDNVAIMFYNTGGTFPAGLASGGAYNSGTAYSVGNTVEYSSKIYVCIQAGTNKTPSDDSANYWNEALFYVDYVSPTTFKVRHTLGGSAIDITGTGTGTNTFSTKVIGDSVASTEIVDGDIVNINTFSSGTISSTQYIFIQDARGYIWYRGQNGGYFTPLNLNPQDWNRNYYNARMGTGLVVFKGADNKNWLLSASATYVSILDVDTFISTGAENWSMNLLAFTNASPHACLWGQDNKIYFCDGNLVRSFSEVGTFDRTNSATYNWAIALTLPKSATANCLEELGLKLLIGDFNSSYIFPWDRFSVTFDTPLRCPENSIDRMLNINNTVYVLAGNKGVIYATTGYNVDVFRKLPEYVTGGQVIWGGLEKVNGHLMVGVNGRTIDTNSYCNSGVFKIFLHTLKPGTIMIDQTFGAYPTETKCDFIMTELKNSETSYEGNDSYYVAFRNSYHTESGISFVTPQQNNSYDSAYNIPRRGNDTAFIETPVVAVSELQEHRSFELIGLELGKALKNGETINVYYRTNITDAYTLLKSFDYANFPDFINDYSTSSITDAQQVQFKICINAKTDSNPYTDVGPRLKTVVAK